MKEQENVQIVEKMFEAFGKGDLPAVLEALAEDIDWQSPVTRTASEEVSWSTPRHSRAEVADYFKELFEKVQPEGIDVSAFTAQGDRVVAEGKNSGSVRSTGHKYEHDWTMIFTVRQGKIVRFRHYYDTMDIVTAF